MPRWILCLSRWSHLHRIKEHALDWMRYAYPARRFSARATSSMMPTVHRAEQLEQRVFLSASLSGTVFSDLNQDGLIDAGEAGVAEITVYVDDNANDVLDAGEVSVTTDSNGSYSFAGLSDGAYQVAVDAPSYWVGTIPATFDQSATVIGGNDLADVDFGLSYHYDETFEAEDATLANGVDFKSAESGYTGTGYADFSYSPNEYVEWSVSLPEAADYTLSFRYAFGSSNRPQILSIDGTDVQTIDWANTGGWSTWDTVDVNATLSAGAHTVRIREDGSSGPNVDSLRITSLAPLPSSNVAPVIDVAAGSSADPVVGTQATLSVTASDADAGDTLTYTWSATSQPSGSSPVFDASNGTSSGDSVMVTFDQQGNYTFEVAVSDGADSVTSSVSLVVAQTLSGLTVSPPSPTIATDATQQFTAGGIDQFGDVMSSGTVTWSADVGTIDSGGNYTAPSTAGTATITASAGGYNAQSTVTVHAAASLPTPAASWSFDVDGDDGVGSNDATLVGGASIDTGLSHEGGGSLALNGNTGYASIGTGSAIDVVKDFTLSAWIYADALGSTRTVFAKVNGGNEKQYLLEVLGDGMLRFQYERGGNGYQLDATVGPLVQAGQWHHVAASIDHSLLIKVYLDGVEVGADTAPIETLSTTDALEIGHRGGPYYDKNYFDGHIDDARFYGEALSASQIATLAGTTPSSNITPVIDIAAGSSFDPVVGTQATLSVSASDADAGDTLTYTWSAASQPSAPSFDVSNGTSSGDSVIVTFDQAGNYTFEVTVSDGTDSVTSSVSLVVAQTLSGLTVSPPSPTLTTDGSQQFTASGVDQFGDAMSSGTVTWSADVGTIDSGGNYTAPSTAGTATITASAGGYNAQSNVTVQAATTSWLLEAEDATLANGVDFKSAESGYTGTGYADFSYSSNEYVEWSVSLPEAADYLLSFRYGFGSSNRPQILSIDGTDVQTIDWPSTGGWSTWDTFDVTTALSAGTHTIRIREDGSSGPNVDSLEITSLAPTSGNVAPVIDVAAASSVDPVTATQTALFVTASDADAGDTLTYTWIPTNTPNGSAPTIIGNGTSNSDVVLVLFDQQGNYIFEVVVSDGADSVTSSVSLVVGQTLSGLTVSPSSPTLTTDAIQQFTASGIDQFGDAMSAGTVTWSADVGTIDSNGNYTAPSAAGTATITASSGDVSEQITFDIELPPNAAPVVTTPAQASSLVNGNEVTLSVAANDPEDGALTYTWSLDSAASTNAVQFVDANGTASSDSMLVRFIEAGVYTFDVMIDDGELFSTSTVDVVVEQILTGISLASMTTNLVDTSYQLDLVANGIDQFGQLMALDTPVWSNTGNGTVDSAEQTYTAPLTTATGSETDTITVESNGITSNALIITINDADYQRREANIPDVVDPASQHYTLTVFERGTRAYAIGSSENKIAGEWNGRAALLRSDAINAAQLWQPTIFTGSGAVTDVASNGWLVGYADDGADTKAFLGNMFIGDANSGALSVMPAPDVGFTDLFIAGWDGSKPAGWNWSSSLGDVSGEWSHYSTAQEINLHGFAGGVSHQGIVVGPSNTSGFYARVFIDELYSEIDHDDLSLFNLREDQGNSGLVAVGTAEIGGEFRPVKNLNSAFGTIDGWFDAGDWGAAFGVNTRNVAVGSFLLDDGQAGTPLDSTAYNTWQLDGSGYRGDLPYEDGVYSGFVWVGSSWYDLNDISSQPIGDDQPADGFRIESAQDINYAGQIVGYGHDIGGVTRGFVLTPGSTRSVNLEPASAYVPQSVFAVGHAIDLEFDVTDGLDSITPDSVEVFLNDQSIGTISSPDGTTGLWTLSYTPTLSDVGAEIVLEARTTMSRSGSGQTTHASPPVDVIVVDLADPTDSDEDGISDSLELYEHGTDPDNFDTDGDLLPDGWELEFWDGTEDGDFSPFSPDDPLGDSDGDGVPNLDEGIFGSDPTTPDTDGDGISDAEEIETGADPTDPADEGMPPASDMHDKFSVTVGDQSGSHSERWQLNVGQYRVVSPDFGKVDTKQLWFDAGESYDIRMSHLATNLDTPDYDWTASIVRAASEAGVTPNPRLPYFIVEDGNKGQNLLPGGSNYNISGATATLHLPQIDLDIDSDNDNGFGPPDRSDQEDRIEVDPSAGKYIRVSNGDLDGDGVVDFADFDGIAGANYVPLILELSENIDAAQWTDLSFVFNYDASDPTAITGSGAPGDPYVPASGSLRLWKTNASTAKNPASDWIEPGTVISYSDLGITPNGQNTLTLYVEAVRSFTDVKKISVDVLVTGDAWSGTLTDSVNITSGGIDLDIDSDNTGLYSGPDRGFFEDEIEEAPNGVKLVVVNHDDLDRDTVPDFADFDGQAINISRPQDPIMRFVPIVVDISDIDQNDLIGATIRFDYEASDPSAVQLQLHDATGLDGTVSARSYTPAPGLIRIWDINASEARDTSSVAVGGNFISADQQLTLASLGLSDSVRTTTLYVEAVNGSPAFAPIEVSLTLSDGRLFTDTIQVLPVSPETGVDPSIAFDQIEGVQIHNGDGSSIYGHDGTDLIFGTSGDDDNIHGQGGDDIIFTGGGNDRVYLDSDGGDDIVVNLSGDLVVEGNPGNVIGYWFNKYTAPPNQRLNYSTVDIMEAYDQLFGLGNPYWQVFIHDANGHISISPVTEDGWLLQLTQSDLNEVTTVHKENGGYGVYVSSRIANPYIAAQLAHARIKQLVRSETDLIDAFFDFTVLNEPDLPKNLEGDFVYDLLEDRAKDFFGTAATMADLYLQGIGIVSVGAEIAFAIDDTARAFKDGGLEAGLSTAAFSSVFIVLPATPSGSWLMKKGDNVIGRVYQTADGFVGDIARVLKQGQSASNDLIAEVTACVDAQQAARVVNSFVPSTIRKIEMDEDLIAYRYRSPDQTGGFYLTTEVLTPDEAKRRLALPSDPLNTAEKVEIVRVKQGETVYIGEVADQSLDDINFGEYATGGGFQIYITDQSAIEILQSGPNP